MVPFCHAVSRTARRWSLVGIMTLIPLVYANLAYDYPRSLGRQGVSAKDSGNACDPFWGAEFGFDQFLGRRLFVRAYVSSYQPVLTGEGVHESGDDVLP